MTIRAMINKLLAQATTLPKGVESEVLIGMGHGHRTAQAYDFEFKNDMYWDGDEEYGIFPEEKQEICCIFIDDMRCACGKIGCLDDIIPPKN